MAIHEKELAAAASKRGYNISLLLSVLLVAFALLAEPAPSLTCVGAALLAWLLVFDGFLQLTCVSQARRRALGWELGIGSLYIAGGGWLLTHSLRVPDFFLLLLIGFLLTGAAADIGTYFFSRHSRAPALSLADGFVICSVASIVWMRWPTSSRWALTTLVGVKTSLAGLNCLMVMASKWNESQVERLSGAALRLQPAPAIKPRPVGSTLDCV